MINIIKTRFIHLKKEWLALLIWLIFPVIATLLMIYLTDTIQDDVRIPIGIVLEEETVLSTELYESIKETPLLRAVKLSEDEAKNQLNKQDLDSVFVIRDGYENNIKKNNRNRLIMSYRSDLSIGYIPVSEMIISYVQQDASRSKSVYAIKDLLEKYNSKMNVTYDEVINQSKIIQEEQSLIHSTFAFNNDRVNKTNDKVDIFKPWHLWAIFTLLATLLIFDWVIKERKSKTTIRFTFMRISFKTYLLQNFVIYTVILGAFDLLTLVAFNMIFDETMSLYFIFVILSYRLLINTGAFLFSLMFNNNFFHYSSAFIVTLITAILSGAIIPIDGIINRFSWIETLNPLNSFLSGEVLNIWVLIFILLILFWYVKKEKYHADSN